MAGATQYIPNSSEMIRAPESFYPGSTFPQAYSGMHDAMPTSTAAFIARATDMTGGEGRSEAKVMRNTTIVPFSGKYAAWMSEVLPGQLLFHVVTDQFDTDKLAVMNLFNVNTVLRKGYESALAMAGAAFTSQQQRVLTTTPTWKWYSLSFLEGFLESPDYNSISYLSPELFCQKFAITGWIEATQQDSSAVQQRAICCYGLADNIENSFASDIQQGERIYLILMRTFDRTSGKYGPYAYHPWAGYEHPPSSVTKYMDVSGHEREGQVYYIGKVNQWTSGEPHFDEAIAVSNGLTGESKDKLPVSQYRPLRVVFRGSPRASTQFAMY